MKKILFLILMVWGTLVSHAEEQQRLFANVGIFAPYTIDATVGYEIPFGYGNAFSVFGEAGNHWRTPVCHNFWKGYYWDGGVNYKHRIARFKNGNLRLVGGMYCGAVRDNFYFGNEVNIEYNHTFSNNWQITLTQRNCINYLHGDLFRNGIMIGLKIPL